MEDRVISFSIRPTDVGAIEDIKLLKEHAKETGVSFSYLILSAVEAKNKELNLKPQAK